MNQDIKGPNKPEKFIPMVKRFDQSELLSDIEVEFKPDSFRDDGVRYVHRKANDLSVIMSFATEADGQIWKHVSFARQKRMPTYNEIEEYKQLFCGGNTYAIIIFPPKDKWVSIHPHCVHLWEPMERYPLPEFSGVIGNIRTI